MVKCSYCKNGTVEVLKNYADFHYDACEPIIEEEPCEECGGYGFLQEEGETEEEFMRWLEDVGIL